MGYSPALVPTVEGLPKFLQEELRAIEDEFNLGMMYNVRFLDVAPLKPREGNVCGADGVNWNPGAGKGVYCYYTGAWHLLG